MLPIAWVENFFREGRGTPALTNQVSMSHPVAEPDPRSQQGKKRKRKGEETSATRQFAFLLSSLKGIGARLSGSTSSWEL